jgi:peptidase E
LNCKPSHLSLFDLPSSDLEFFILEKNAIYVGGGNTKSCLPLLKEWKLDVYLKKAWEAGVVLSGISAGTNCWFEKSVTESQKFLYLPIQLHY